MGRWGMLVLALLLWGCTMATSTYDPVAPTGGPPFTVQYGNTTSGTTGTVPVDSKKYDDGATVTVMGNSGNLSWPGWTFVGWNTRNSGGANGGGGGDLYAPGATFVIHSHVVLHGQWDAN